MDGIRDKVVVITGGSSGIGAAIGIRLAQQGAAVVLAARRKDKLEAVRDAISKAGGRATLHEVDVTCRDQVEKLIKDSVDEHGRVDVMINNAGLMAMAPLAERKVDEWERMIDINIKGVLYGVAAAWPEFERQGKGHFINLSSVAGLKVATPGGGVVYSATKFAVRAISEGIRVESAGRFRSTVICPGYVESELMLGSSDPAARENIVKNYERYAIPAESVADAVVYAICQPDKTAINEIVIRPTSQEF